MLFRSVCGVGKGEWGGRSFGEDDYGRGKEGVSRSVCTWNPEWDISLGLAQQTGKPDTNLYREKRKSYIYTEPCMGHRHSVLHGKRGSRTQKPDREDKGKGGDARLNHFSFIFCNISFFAFVYKNRFGGLGKRRITRSRDHNSLGRLLRRGIYICVL